tara:strand:- start:6345 stop:6863 length:519 start_codon:yes stop_codon:yes gene_type:complete
MITVRLKGDRDIERSFSPKFRSTISAVGKTGKNLKSQILTVAPSDSGRLKESVDGLMIIKSDMFAYDVSIDTRRAGAKINYAWYFVEGGFTPGSGDRDKVRAIPKSELTPKQRSMPVLAAQLGSKSDAVFFKRVSNQYRRKPFLRSVAINAANKHRSSIPKAIMKDMRRRGK